MVNAMIVDDREDFVDQFKAEARAHKINIVSKTNLKDMIEFLPQNASKLSMVILDIKCLKEPNQEFEHENFLPAALMFLDKEYSYMPRAILTADSVSYDEVKRYHSDEKIFRKTEEHINNLFGLINKKSLELPDLRIRAEFADVFCVFSKGYLENEKETELLELLKNMGNKEPLQIKNNLLTIRRLQERVFQVLNKYNKAIVPDNCLSANGNVNFRNVDKHLKGNKSYQSRWEAVTTNYYSGVIEAFSPMLYNISSAMSAHNPYNDLQFPPTQFTVRSCAYALIDFLIWFERQMDDSFPKS